MLNDIKDGFNKIFISSIISSIIFIALGIFLVVKPETTINTISYILGILIILLGSMSFSKYFKDKKNDFELNFNLIYGILSIVIGLILIINPTAIATIIPFILGFWMIINSTIKIQYSLNLKKYNNKAWISTLSIGIITLIWGLILIFNPFEGALLITKMIGLFIIIYSILDIIESLLLNKNIKLIVKK